MKFKDLSCHPLNLAARFIMEMTSLLAAGLWGYHWAVDSYLIGIGLPIAMMVIWAIFAVPGDRSRSGNAPVPIPGILRLLLELSFFGFGTWAFFDLGNSYIGLVFGVIVFAHYIISLKRVSWLLRQ